MIRKLSLVTAAFGMLACGAAPAPKHSDDPAVVAAAKEVWNTRCATCHGPQGMGNGVNAVNLKTQPRSFHNADWQQQTSDDRIRQVIVQGGGSVGLSTDMAPNPELADKPAVVDELLAIVRDFG